MEFFCWTGSNIFENLNKFPHTLNNLTDNIFQGIKTSADKIYIVEELETNKEKVKIFSKQDAKNLL